MAITDFGPAVVNEDGTGIGTDVDAGHVNALRTAVNGVEGKFETTGHKHTGAAGDGPKLTHGSLIVPAARVYHNVAQSIPTAVGTLLAFNSERFDTDAIHDVTTNNSRLTCKTAGKYLIFANVEFAANATGVRYINIALNGATVIGSQTSLSSDVTIPARINASVIYDLAVNDYIEVNVYQDSGGALNVTSAANFSPEFGMVRIA